MPAPHAMLLRLAERCLQSSCRKALSKQELRALGEVEGFCGGECGCGPKVISDISHLCEVSTRLHYGGDSRRQRTCLPHPPRFSHNSNRNATAGRAGAVTLLATLCARISFHLCFPQSPTTCLDCSPSQRQSPPQTGNSTALRYSVNMVPYLIRRARCSCTHVRGALCWDPRCSNLAWSALLFPTRDQVSRWAPRRRRHPGHS
ncbi:hypothetical protein OH76DRAFT_745654 [Lentinus brumalis]|uniref:Uncharacterized protein n=1 Tax=Lentinus brumalis TaxID=2498619 RepID=A0A371DSF5_9APHY|nr:hypothetical protein OH76DRAFT_745654 [Polyporus brumalis]